ncbi:MAG: chemotaxis protein CheX [Acidobacteriia bacterium]|nr:chemotaxis protein CheX [Terriglobia bacterium]MBV8904408.1 chemotaxis protein CheX [Terriglobia bacterium]
MNVQNLIVSSLQHSVMQVFSTMLTGDIEFGGLTMENSTADVTDRVVSFIGIAGTWSGTGSVTCSPVAACRVCSQMLMADYTSVTEEVLDAVAELTNMIIGNVKSDLERHLGPLGLSIPTVVFGRNFKTKSASAEWIVERFQWDGEEILLRVSLRPSEKSVVETHGRGVYALEV